METEDAEKTNFDRLLDKFAAPELLLRPEYFGVDTAELAALLKDRQLGVYRSELAEVHQLAAAGNHAKASKRFMEIQGCEMADAVLAVDLLQLVPADPAS